MPLLPFIPVQPIYSSEALDPPILDKVTGLPLANGQVFFYQDLNRIVPQPVYEISGSPPNYTYNELPNPMFLSAKGTFVDNNGADIAVYYYPWDDFGNFSPYYIQVFNSQNVPQFVRQNWPPIPAGAEGPGEEGNTSIDNIIANGQFGFVNWNPLTNPATQFVLTIPGAVVNQLYPVMPGWSLLVSSTGAGTVTLNQLAVAGANNYPGQPPYLISISSSGAITTLGLEQIFTGNPNIFSQDLSGNGGWVTTSLLIGPASSAIVNYISNNGGPVINLLNVPMNVSGQYQQVSNTVQLPQGTNPGLGNTSSSAIQILFPISNHANVISNVQVVPSFQRPATPIAYSQVPLTLQQSELFSYYQPALNYKPIPSYLVGWDFPFNPAQINGDDVAIFAGANQAQYFWDQTIVYQTVTNSVSGSRATNGGLTLTAVQPGQIALIQYLDATTARKILSDQASVHMSLSGTIAAGSLAGAVSLYATTDANLPTLPTTLITTMGANGIPTALATANWSQVPNAFNNNVFSVSTASATNSESADIYLNGWDLAGAAPVNTATYFAIVVGFAPWANLDTITFNSIALCAGDIATRPAPKTKDETLLDTQRFFYSTFLPGIKPVTAAGINTGCVEFQLVSTRGIQANAPFPTTMRTTPNLIVYNPVNANNQIYDVSTTTDCAATATDMNNTVRAYALVANVPGSGSPASGDVLQFHLTADARLGVVN